MSTLNTEYVTNQGDRLDLISSKAYGDAFRGKTILEANPSLPILPEYPAGIRLVIPVQAPVRTASENLLPPWKKNQTA